MKTLQYRITLVVALFFGILLNAQQFDKKYSEQFNTNSDVVIDVDTRHTDIEIETWNKNMVTIEATIVIEGASKEKADEIIKNWKFKALGNKNEIEIISKTSGLFTSKVIHSNGDILHIGDHDFDLDFDHDFDFVVPEVSVHNLGILDSFHVAVPDAFHFPEPPVIIELDHDFHFDFDMPEFDYEKYKNDKNYMKQWQKKMKKSLEKMKVEWKDKSDRSRERSAERKEELKARLEERKQMQKERIEAHKERMEERMEERKREAKIRKEVLIKRKKELAMRREDIKIILADRNKIKIKRVIKIKAPKDAKFNMDVKYGAMSFPN